jgi:phage-related protein
MNDRLTEIPVIFYRPVGGVEPIRAWLKSLPPEDRQAIGTDLSTVQFGWPIGMPLCRALGSGLWEVRSSLPSRRIARLLFFVHEGRIGVVHGFIKKTQKTPPEDIALARKRMKEMKA